MTFLSVPSNALAILALLAFIVLALRLREGITLALMILAAIVVAGLSPVGNMLLTPLEQRFPAGRYPPDGAIEGIIVLGGSYDTVSHSYLSTIVLQEDTEPMAVMVDLARRYPRAKIIFSGGTDPSYPGPSEASIVKNYFISFGIDPARIVVEGRSQTTEENAQFSSQLLHPSPRSRWLLVTSAYHMPRSVGAFRHAGFNVYPFPVGARTHGWKDMWRPSSTATDNFRRLDVALHEWLGLFDYKLKGFSDGWYPAPDRKLTPPPA